MIESLNCPIGTYLHFLTGHRCFDIKRGFGDLHIDINYICILKKVAKRNLAMDIDVVRI